MKKHLLMITLFAFFGIMAQAQQKKPVKPEARGSAEGSIDSMGKKKIPPPTVKVVKFPPPAVRKDTSKAKFKPPVIRKDP